MNLHDLFSRKNDPSNLGVDDALMMMSKGGRFIDVRSPKTYERGHIPGAQLVSPAQLDADPLDAIWGDDPLAMLEDPDDLRARSLIVVADTPAQASARAAALREQGFTDVWTMDLLAWIRSGQILVPGPARP